MGQECGMEWKGTEMEGKDTRMEAQEPWKEIACWEIEEIIKQNNRIVDEKFTEVVGIFVASGFYLRRQYDERMHESEGYVSFWDYVKDRYGKSRSWATRMMQINEKFSMGGNDPRIDSDYVGYGISQLQEMLYLDNVQLEGITPDMTVKDIRGIRKKPELEPETEPELEPELEGVETLCDVAQKELSETDPEATKNLCDVAQEELPEPEAEQEGTVAPGDIAQEELDKPDERQRRYLEAFAVYFIRCNMDWFREDYQSRVLDVVSSPKEIKSMLGVDCRKWSFKVPEGHVAGINLFDERVVLWDENNVCMGRFGWFYLAAAIQDMYNYAVLEAEEEAVDGEVEDEDEAVEHCAVELEPMGKELYEELTELSDLQLAMVELDKAEVVLEDLLRCFSEKDKRVRNQKVLVDAIAVYVGVLETVTEGQSDEPEQPALPILKNNEQRKAFIDGYTSWPVWVDTGETEEKYYKYDLPDGESFVVRVYYHKIFDTDSNAENWEERYKDAWGGEEYYLLEEGKHFRDCLVNRSHLVDRLKEIQKGSRS